MLSDEADTRFYSQSISTSYLRLAVNTTSNSGMKMQTSAKPGHDLLAFINSSPTPFHAVRSSRQLLESAGFTEVKERQPWSSACKPGGKYYLTRNGSTLVAFAIGKQFKPGNPFAMIGAHTDSPCMRIKPVSKKQNCGFLQVGVEMYGGGRWSSWFDRDLSIAGRIFAREKDGKTVQKLIKVDRPVLRIPTLAIHLDREDPPVYNKETQLVPIAGLIATQLNTSSTSHSAKDEADCKVEPALVQAPKTRHHSDLIDLIAREAGVTPEAIEDFELVLYDTQKACSGGLMDEFIFAARLDNLCMSFCATTALIRSCEKKSSLDSESSIRLIALFDHEEIGSTSAQGADSDTLPAILRRLSVIGTGDHSITSYEQSLAGSFLISADMAHSVHPNYAEKYEANHRPEMNKGTVIKINANARYATNSPGIVLLNETARRAGVPLQSFVVRNDSSCGSTIGPMLSAALGTRTLDLGNAQLSMHSIRETAGIYDVDYAIRLFDSFFRNYSELEQTIVVD